MAIPAQRLKKERPRRIYYPVRDGKPMAETDKHADLMIYYKEALRAHYKHDENVYVSGNNFVFYEEGNPKARVSPDVYVVFGVPKHQRDSYKVWEEGGKLPDVVFEFTSKKTQREDVHTKRPLYERLRIPEYFQFDPTGDYLKPRLQGFRLEAGKYVPMRLKGESLHSERLHLDFEIEGDWLAVVDPATGERLPSLIEQTERVAFLKRLAETEIQMRQIAEERAAMVEELRRMAEEMRQMAEGRAQMAEEMRQMKKERADFEKQRAERAEADVAHLRAEIEALKRRE